jgi:hypothetical protein
MATSAYDHHGQAMPVGGGDHILRAERINLAACEQNGTGHRGGHHLADSYHPL